MVGAFPSPDEPIIQNGFESGQLIDDIGCWISRRDGFAGKVGGGALFIDRDGLLVTSSGCARRPEDVAFLEGVLALIALANRHDIPVILIHNQPGIAQGLSDWHRFMAVNGRIAMLLACEGARIDATLACAWHRHGIGRLRTRYHPWQKPHPGMFRAAQAVFGISLGQSWLASTHISDIRTARTARLAGALLVHPSAGPARHRRSRSGFRLLSAASLPAILDRPGRLASLHAARQPHERSAAQGRASQRRQ